MLAFVLAAIFCGAQALYIDPGNPYDDGPLLSTIQTAVIEKDTNGLPIKITVYYPDFTGDEVGLNLFIGGFYGFWSGEMYSDTLKKVASHGAVVMSIDTDLASLPGFADNILATVEWARNNLANFISSRIDYSAVQFSCHSAGCQGVLLSLKQDPSAALSAAFTDPVAFEIANPLPDLGTPAIIYGTELAGACVSEGLTFDTFYEKWSCTKILHVVQGYGHCDYMDDAPQSTCVGTGFCNGASSGIAAHRQYVQGIIAGMFMWQVQGQSRIESFLTNQNNIPQNMVEFLTDVC